MKKVISAAVVTLVASANALAVEDTWYGKVSFGVSDLDVGQLESDLCTVDLCYDFGTDKGFAFNVGYRFSRNFAVEGGYTDLGEVSDTDDVTAIELDSSLPAEEVNVTTALSSSNLSMAALATTDISKPLSAGAKLGFHFWETELDISVPGMPGSQSVSEDGTDIFYGVFANWRTGNWNLGVEYTVFQTEVEGERMDPTLAAVSLSMDF